MRVLFIFIFLFACYSGHAQDKKAIVGKWKLGEANTERVLVNLVDSTLRFPDPEDSIKASKIEGYRDFVFSQFSSATLLFNDNLTYKINMGGEESGKYRIDKEGVTLIGNDSKENVQLRFKNGKLLMTFDEDDGSELIFYKVK